MGFWEKIWKKKSKYKYIEETAQDEADDAYLISPEQIDIHNDKEREKYVASLLEQMADAASAAKDFQKEYHIVDQYLKDMEEFDYIKPEDKKLLLDLAKKISRLQTDKTAYEEKGKHLSDEDFAKAERFERENEDGIEKLKVAEDYQNVVRDDLKKLESEKQACLYRKSEAAIQMENLRGMVQISTIALAVCLLVLLFMQFGFQMDTKIGYILLAAVYAAALLIMFLSYLDASKEHSRAMKSINKLILLQNRVKIRYVNNTNLLEYLYMKYEVNSFAQLNALWEQYQAEKDERAKMAEAMQELDQVQKDLVGLLRSYRLHDPVIWIHQTDALLDPKEMVEVRHALIARRQKLRKQIEFNTKNSESAQAQIKELVGSYPQYAKEILKKVSDYEEEYPSL